ncbi:hypothetical protein L1887_33441 [Cichorium endivia]|nr:hypothetical protein L1887_33441 [Cichorium endivia]
MGLNLLSENYPLVFYWSDNKGEQFLDLYIFLNLVMVFYLFFDAFFYIVVGCVKLLNCSICKDGFKNRLMRIPRGEAVENFSRDGVFVSLR